MTVFVVWSRRENDLKTAVNKEIRHSVRYASRVCGLLMMVKIFYYSGCDEMKWFRIRRLYSGESGSHYGTAELLIGSKHSINEIPNWIRIIPVNLLERFMKIALDNCDKRTPRYGGHLMHKTNRRNAIGRLAYEMIRELSETWQSKGVALVMRQGGANQA